MTIQFPNNPINGQVYSGYYYDSTLNAWKASPVGAGPASISDTAPSGAIHGDMWYNSADGTMYIYVNDGTSSQWVEIHSNTAATPGSIIQVVQVAKTDTWSASTSGQTGTPTTSNTWSVMTASITPKLSNSKILINGNLMYSASGSTPAVTLFRGSTPIGIGDAAGSRRRSIAGTGLNVDTNQISGHGNFSFFDSPATTSAITYDVRLWSDNTMTMHVNRSPADLDSATGVRPISTITLMEVAQ